jgi:D-alanyl-D-alanine carboxypeptidase (penicillin-binding protein 5/6)
MPVVVFAQGYTQPEFEPFASPPPEIISQSAVMIDAETGTVIYSKNPHDEIPPASLTKLMTMHLLMKEINAGRASYDEIIPITVASWAQSQPPGSSLMFLEPGQIVTLREILMGLAVPSGNDAAVAAALRLAPSMDEFAQMMTAEARRMGLSVTSFTESSGICENNITTAAEFVYFSQQYIKMYPRSLEEFHSVTVFSYPVEENFSPAFRNNTRTVTQHNRNALLRTFPGVDGLKTGYIVQSGFNISLTAQRNQQGEDTRFIAVILGAPSGPGGDRIRNADGASLLTWAFDNFKTTRPRIQHIEGARLWKGRENTVELRLADSPNFTSPLSRSSMMLHNIFIPAPLIAPLPAGYPVGHLIFYDQFGELSRVRLVTARSYERGNIFKRIWHSILLLFQR